MVKFYVGESEYESMEEALERLQSILLARVENKLGAADDLEYRQLRRALMNEPGIRERLPRVVTVNSETGGVWAILRDHSDQWEPRRAFVREQMRSALDYARSPQVIPSSAWTGIQGPKERLVAARSLLPLAYATVEGLIAELERPIGNLGPPMEDRQEAIENLKALHGVLGECIAALESGSKSLNELMLKEAAGFLGRAARLLKGDPMPYMVAGGLAGLLSVIGAGELGTFLAGIALTIKKNAG